MLLLRSKTSPFSSFSRSKSQSPYTTWPHYLADLISCTLLVHSTPATLPSLLFFRYIPTSELFTCLFPLLSSPHISTWFTPSHPSSFCLNVIFLMRFSCPPYLNATTFTLTITISFYLITFLCWISKIFHYVYCLMSVTVPPHLPSRMQVPQRRFLSILFTHVSPAPRQGLHIVGV